MKKFSFILCSYNGAKRITRSIESILKLDNYDKLIDKLIFVDNNSTDTTGNIMKEFCYKKHNIEYVNENKQGLSYARLAGLRRVNSSWIVMIDDDNILEHGWLVLADEYITHNPGIGAFNGGIIPLIEEPLTPSERKTLEIVYPSLACTSLSVEDLRYKPFPYNDVVGAGLVILTAPLQELADNGWLKNKGRTGTLLSSGEDTEMSQFILKKGYKIGYNPNMILWHLIEKRRLQIDYLLKLYKGFGDAVFMSKIGSGNIKTRFILAARNIGGYLARMMLLIFVWEYKRRLRLKLQIMINKSMVENVIRYQQS